MNFIDIVIIIGVLFIAAFAVEFGLTKLLNIPIREKRYINDQHKQRYKQFIFTFGIALLIIFTLYILGQIIIFIPITLIMLYPIASSIVDMVMELKYDRESRRYIISISNIIVYVAFLVILFTTDFFGLL
ncbi:DUF4181 domain-containing protein [Tenuibacillus multivorans]|uniref:DUF4181 domain-containing protein n=1 Tax=Tenuibacillus multivorans TaxID=237069 RepID=A0A1H0AQQ9_9BACI|nr:DUF4181 domain-containing protein [Tenuibacillus multivorans]GEL77857.1 hypothetical protein TMU01_20920 [Tenuibacillus multivorans]SDN35882.1 protein of unknown function [Tenuibacillus multivorans]